ncbi:MAG: hypothetical protein Q9162_004560 [Coniocarpon cinnabarinum]
MDKSSIVSTLRPLRFAVEGCGHGELHPIYSSIQKSCRARGWRGIDLLIIGGDFQACRNNHDMNWMAVPPKYRGIKDFHEYYSGKRVAPYLTIFIGGNHEASNHLQELYYGGWVAPNIYYLGAANVINVGGVRIAGMSGIWKGYDYRKPHYHMSSLGDKDIKQMYHTREIDVRKLMQLRTQVDVGLSHDWPKGVEQHGDLHWLLRVKKHFKEDVQRKLLGSNAASYVLNHLRPFYWFSAHLHVKYAAVVHHQPHSQEESNLAQCPDNADELSLDDEVENVPQAIENPDEISLEDDDTKPTTSVIKQGLNAAESLQQPAILNSTTQFLALDKCLPKRDFLQLLEIPRRPTGSQHSDSGDAQLEYDEEWLGITRVFAQDVIHKRMHDPQQADSPPDRNRQHYSSLVDAEVNWVRDNIVNKGRLVVPRNFQPVAPVYDPRSKFRDPNDRPAMHPNPQMEAFCNMLEIPNPLQ